MFHPPPPLIFCGFFPLNGTLSNRSMCNLTLIAAIKETDGYSTLSNSTMLQTSSHKLCLTPCREKIWNYTCKVCMCWISNGWESMLRASGRWGIWNAGHVCELNIYFYCLRLPQDIRWNTSAWVKWFFRYAVINHAGGLLRASTEATDGHN